MLQIFLDASMFLANLRGSLEESTQVAYISVPSRLKERKACFYINDKSVHKNASVKCLSNLRPNIPLSKIFCQKPGVSDTLKTGFLPQVGRGPEAVCRPPSETLPLLEIWSENNSITKEMWITIDFAPSP